MNVLVTGHHGYIGSVLVRVLSSAGHTVTGLDTLYYDGCDLTPAKLEAPTLRVDIRDVEAAQLRGFDAVVHLAALSNDPLGDLDRELTLDINFRATVRVAEVGREAGVSRFVFSSSCSMYGAATDGLVAEDAPLRPLTAYAESKVRSEEALADLADDSFSPVFMRNATAYGASPRLRLDLVLNNLVAWAHTTGRVKIMSDGTPWRPLIHVEDIGRATLAALDAPRELVHGEAFNVGRGEENHQVRDLGAIVERTIEGCEIEYAGSGDPDPRSYRVDFAKFERTFPEAGLRWSAELGARELHDAYAKVGLTLSEFEGDRYTRLKRLSTLLERGDLDGALRWRRTAPLAAEAG